MRQLSAPAESDEPTTVDQDEEEPQDAQHEGQETYGPGPEGPVLPSTAKLRERAMSSVEGCGVGSSAGES